jgi:hypothetical protein
MAISLADLQIFYSGATSNSDLALSIGGAISSTRVLHQSATGVSLIGGVVVNDASGNAVGNGTLTYTHVGTTLTWVPPSGSAGVPIDVSTGGRFSIQGSGTLAGCLFVTVTPANLPSANTSDTVTIANQLNKMFADVAKATSLTGEEFYLCLAVKNCHATDSMVNVLEWISANTPGQDNVTMALDALAASDGSVGPTATANNTTAPAGVTFVNPTSSTDTNVLNIGTLAAGQCRFIWYKLTVPANVSAAQAANTFNPAYSITA